MRQIAEGVWQVPLAPRDSVNAYVLGDVLVDAGTARMGRKLPRRLSAVTVNAHAITHAHPDHVGGSGAVVEQLGIPLWVPENDAAAVEAGAQVTPESRLKPIMDRIGRFPAAPVARVLTEGDEVGGFTVLDTPGHSPGHVSFWRESDRVLVCGDVWFHMDFRTFRPALRAPLNAVTVDPARNRRSMQRLVELRPEVVCFGHGPVMRNAAAELRAL